MITKVCNFIVMRKMKKVSSCQDYHQRAKLDRSSHVFVLTWNPNLTFWTKINAVPFYKLIMSKRKAGWTDSDPNHDFCDFLIGSFGYL